MIDWDLLERLAVEATFKFARRVSTFASQSREDFQSEILCRAAEKASQPAFARALSEVNMPVLRVSVANIALDVIREWNDDAVGVSVSWGVNEVGEALDGGRPDVLVVFERLPEARQRVIEAAVAGAEEYFAARAGMSRAAFRARLSEALAALNRLRDDKFPRSFSIDAINNGGENVFS